MPLAEVAKRIMACSIYAFDAYGTLFDVHAAVRRHAAALGPDAAARLRALARQPARIQLGAEPRRPLQGLSGR